MDRSLNIQNIEQQMLKMGLNQSQLASGLGLSREAVSKWFKGENLPSPSKLLKLSKILKLSFEQLHQNLTLEEEPIVAFRRKARRKIDPSYEKYAKDIGRMLTALVPYLPNNSPSAFHNSESDYNYIQNLVKKIRKEIGRELEESLDYIDFVDQFRNKAAILVPVFLGERQHHENAIHIYLPSSRSTWIYLNLDSKEQDFKFWMAHELGHIYSPNLKEDEAEDFADAFAQALLYPKQCAEKFYQKLLKSSNKGVIINNFKEEAKKHKISPYTIYKSVENYIRNEKGGNGVLPITEMEIVKANSNFDKEFSTMAQVLFSGQDVTPENYFLVVTQKFKSPFFEMLRKCISENNLNEGFITNILKSNLMDSKAVYRALCAELDQQYEEASKETDSAFHITDSDGLDDETW